MKYTSYYVELFQLIKISSISPVLNVGHPFLFCNIVTTRAIHLHICSTFRLCKTQCLKKAQNVRFNIPHLNNN